MGPTVWAKMANATGKKECFEFMDKEFKASTDYLYSKKDSLYFRDSRYFTKKEANGKPVFWGRGNGWVFAGLPIIISELPENYKNRDYYVEIFKEMAHKLLELQDEKGYWHASMLDPDSYPNPEMSSTAFFVYGMAWGINNGILDKETYLPAVKKGWKAMVESVWPDGKFGWVQPIGQDPKKVTKEITEVYGVGGFLLAGTEVYKLAK
jgi:rhamnogalacturonyl hydrolase YesR